MFSTLLIALAGTFVISGIVFGGGQVFLPFFKILIVDLMQIEDSLWESALTLANATPGVFSTKLAFISGYLAAQGEWWGYLAMFSTYLVFAVIPITVMFFAMRTVSKLKTNRIMIAVNRFMKPIVAGIMFALVVQLFISLAFPFIIFNDLSQYVGVNADPFFREWRLYVLISFSIVAVGYSYYFLIKKKTNMLWLILVNIVIAMLLFQPWLM